MISKSNCYTFVIFFFVLITFLINKFENLITTNFGQYKLSTKQNNKLRWINKSDRVTIPTNSVNISTLFCVCFFKTLKG